MELLDYNNKQHANSSAGSPRWESRYLFYENVCDTLPNVEVTEASAAPPAPRTGRRTRYAIACLLHKQSNSIVLPLSKFPATTLFVVSLPLSF